ncbi:MAG: translation initiation factor IF-2 [Flavobacteriales bacterium]|nr:translation initiation factor IF-2 [Flavobacteriales bacterium]
MSEIKKAVRLSKVAREFNVGISTIVDYLKDQGIAIEQSPNTKIEPDVYKVLLNEFEDEKTKKEKTQRANITRTERKTITLESNKPAEEPVQEEEEEELDLSVFKSDTTPLTPPAPEKEEVKEEEKAPEPVAETPKEEEKKEEAPKEEETPVAENKEEAPAHEAPAKEEPAAKAEVKEEAVAETEDNSPLKVVGKVDLDALKPKKKPKAKQEEKPKAEEPKKPAAKAEPQKKEVPAKEKEAPEDPAKPTKPAEPEFIKTEVKKLTGPTVVGKIELPKEPTKKKREPVASSSDANLKKKRKRKRISQNDNRGGGNQNRGRGRKKEEKPELTEAQIQKEIKETLARLSGGGKSKSSKLRRAKRDAVAQREQEELDRREEEAKILKLTEFVTVSDLGTLMNVSVNEVISACMSLGIMVSINQRLDADTIQVIAEEFGYEVEFVSAEVQDSIIIEEDKEEDLSNRPPIVTVMGHVDHGKTSLLDHIRKANVIAGEAGGITQHIGAYNVQVAEGKTITFLDTPGHEAFTAMRARGAQVTDLAIIVVAADDAVMPQTKEAINHAQAAGIPMIFAINKIDRQESNPDKIKEELSQMNILVEDWGGKYQSQEISAKKGTNVDELLEKVLLEAELLELKAVAEKRALGTVIESSLDKGRGYVSTLLVEGGTLKVGDSILAGQWSGKVKAMYNERQQRVKTVGPAMPVSILGLNGAPNAGDKFHVLEDEKEARNIAAKRQQLQREQGVRTQTHVTMDDIARRIAIGEFKELKLVIKGDVDGSIEALSDALEKLSTEKIEVNVIHKAVGQISESDVLLASASDAIIIGFQVRPSANARKLAENDGIQIRLYSVIYKAIEEMKEAMEGLLSAKIEERVTGTAEIRETFRISKVGTIAGCFMLDGKIHRNDKVRVIRDGIVVYTGNLGSLKRFKDDVKEVSKGFEFGLNVDKFNDIKVGDVIEGYEEVEVKQTLDD